MLASKQPWWEVARQNQPAQPLTWWQTPPCDHKSSPKPEVVVHANLWERFLGWFNRLFS